jgi:hypothetical protein
VRPEPPGVALLDELRDALPADAIEADLRRFAALGGTDRSTEALRARTGAAIDLMLAPHREALLVWLRAWGCRHLRVGDTRRSSDALRRWWIASGGDLPPVGSGLTDLPDERLAPIGSAYEALARRRAATRASGHGDVAVTFGDTGASKALYALRPDAVPPWDAPMRAALGWRRADAAAFADYLRRTRDALLGLSARLGVPVADLPHALGRPGSSPPRLVDELLWIRLTHDRRPPPGGRTV